MTRDPRREPGELWTREVLMRYIDVEPSGCWRWTGPVNGPGYGMVYDPARKRNGVGAHRLSYELFVGPIPDGLFIDHLCSNPPCCNPKHLEPVTHAENLRRASERRTHCIHGHEVTPDNTWWNRTGKYGYCKACKQERDRLAYIARKTLALSTKGKS